MFGLARHIRVEFRRAAPVADRSIAVRVIPATTCRLYFPGGASMAPLRTACHRCVQAEPYWCRLTVEAAPLSTRPERTARPAVTGADAHRHLPPSRHHHFKSVMAATASRHSRHGPRRPSRQRQPRNRSRPARDAEDRAGGDALPPAAIRSPPDPAGCCRESWRWRSP